MSYTRTYNGSVTVTGDVTVNYPASQYGGSKTVSYSQTVPLSFNVTVETTPFDQSINSASNQVNGLTAAVAAMNTANCAAITANANRISDSIIDGFYGLIQNDITTKKAECSTLIQTKSALLLAHSEAVRDKHDRMLNDVERERAKFGMVFAELDKELERRVTELDKPAFKLSKKVRDEIVLKPFLTSAAMTTDQISTGGDDTRIAIAGLRQKISTVLQHLVNSLKNNLSYRQMMHDILWKKDTEEEQLSYIPVAYCISQDLQSANKRCNCFVSDNANKQQILESVFAYINESSVNPPRAVHEDDMKLIQQAFSSMVQDEYTSFDGHDEYRERVYTEIFRLWKEDSGCIKQI
ncbi:MAG: hypothetical protein IJZ95_08970 [Oscillospiraceae bacterium]|nr:hypothetical protein [Oscillospiraceae bacterium]